MKKLSFASFVHSFCLILVLIVTGSRAKVCGDPECKTPIARAYATINYFGGGGQKVTVAKNDKVEILGRDIGKERDLLIRKADGKEGLVSRSFVQEIKILVKKDNLVVVPEDVPTSITPSKTADSNVVAGTTLNTADILEQSNVDQPLLSVKAATPDLETVPSGQATSQQSNSIPPKADEANSIDAVETKSNETEVLDNVEDAQAEEEDEDEEEEEDDEEEEIDSASDSAEQKKEPTVQEEANLDTLNKTDEVLDKAEESIVVSTEQPETTTENSIANENEPVVSKPSDTTTAIPAIETTKAEPAEHSINTVEEITARSDINEAVDASKERDDTVIEQNDALHEESDSLNGDTAVQPTTEHQTDSESNDDTIIVSTVDPRLEIPVTEEPEIVTEPSTFASTNQNVIEQSAPQVVDLPKQPHQLLRGGLGNLLAHSHHHHHHHGHDHHHHHGHDNQHHHHDHGHVNHHHADSDNEGLAETSDKPFIGGFGGESQDQKIEIPEPSSEENSNLLQQDDVADNTGYCDKQSCPQPAEPVSHQQHANGFHHPTVSIPAIKTQQEQPAVDEENAIPPALPEDSAEKEEDINITKMLMVELFKMSDLILLLGITSFTLIVFSLGHYLINKNRKEKPLIYKLNMIERDLMASHKENAMLKSDLVETKHKLTSIENSSFGSNDMVIALREELSDAEQTKLELQEQIASLEKELEAAAEAGLELNKMVAELLNQSGSETIALTVDDLQRQLNEQQQTILSMNTTLADKSRENSELQITLAAQSAKFSQDLEELQQSFNDLKLEKSNLEIELNHMKSGQNSELDTLRKETNAEIGKLNKEVKVFQAKWEESKKSLGSAEAKVDALEECLKEIKRGNSNGTVDGLIDSVELKAQVAVLKKEKLDLQERLQGETVARQLLDDHVKIINEEISALKKDYGQAEKDKLEAETRLEVLSSYFKDKETQLQKELSIKEAMWMQQQGETTSTVERIRLMQDEIQQLKSQNDKLRAEIEAQATAHKAQYTALETRSHDAWLAARQAERRLEEARNESSALRRKLTALGDASVINTSNTDGLIPNPVPSTDLNLTAPSPIRVESPNAPMMGLPPPPFMPPPFGPPFMPPFMPPPGPGELRPAPLGRLTSPPPNRYSPNVIESRDRYSPDRGRYSPDSRYDYSVMSNYETETDFSPPPSPPPYMRRSSYERDRDAWSNRERDRERERGRDRDRDRDRDHDLPDRDRDVRERDGRTSGSGGAGGKYPKAFSPPGMRTTSPPIQDPRNKKYQGGFSSGSQDSIATRKGGKQFKNPNSKPSS
ncbi:transport and Golgi organization protein 1 [Sabethes cyaneus]|uniref:transport and Golgi organization protein 1 n=1 Tax=Sabethes cyaneus TaxID=53552 RepID=UPI00237E47DA|nr:transport and Golgi organization protein 1 [Sabethes cyaneus]